METDRISKITDLKNDIKFIKTIEIKSVIGGRELRAVDSFGRILAFASFKSIEDLQEFFSK